ncbi:MAG: hypothetical protein AB7Q29_06160 [Vicinamibacterales bacterium]
MLPIALLIISSIFPSPPSVSSPGFDGTQRSNIISIRVFDYAWLDARALRAAEEQVADTYRRIGIRTTWMPVVRPWQDGRAPRHETLAPGVPLAIDDAESIAIDGTPGPTVAGHTIANRTDTGDAGLVLTVVFVRDQMVTRAGVPRTVAGYAAGLGRDGARAAVVLPDRTARIAWRAGVAHSRVLGVVMAHELAHLLLPNRPHARVGLTRGDWAPSEFVDSRRWTFSPDEAASIRRSVAGHGRGASDKSD